MDAEVYALARGVYLEKETRIVYRSAVSFTDEKLCELILEGFWSPVQPVQRAAKTPDGLGIRVRRIQALR